MQKLFKNRSTLNFPADEKVNSERYLKLRKVLFFSTGVLIVCVAVINYQFEIYQRGVSFSDGPLSLARPLFTWLLLSGLSVLTASLVFWELLLGKRNIFFILLILVEGFFSNVSMLSRGFILNTVPQIWALFKQKNLIGNWNTIKNKIFIGVLFFAFMLLSILFVSLLRAEKFKSNYANEIVPTRLIVHQSSISLFFDRWVGIEGVLSVSSYKDLGWDLWHKAWAEKSEREGTSFYDKEISRSIYLQMNGKEQIFITLPGLIAFLFYPGSFSFLFFGIFLVTVILVLLELGANVLTKNPLLVALFAESAVYRMIHFGFNPQNSYLYYLAFIMNLGAIYFLQKFILKIFKD